MRTQRNPVPSGLDCGSKFVYFSFRFRALYGAMCRKLPGGKTLMIKKGPPPLEGCPGIITFFKRASQNQILYLTRQCIQCRLHKHVSSIPNSPQKYMWHSYPEVWTCGISSPSARRGTYFESLPSLTPATVLLLTYKESTVQFVILDQSHNNWQMTILVPQRRGQVTMGAGHPKASLYKNPYDINPCSQGHRN